jgi:hypothetical protein
MITGITNTPDWYPITSGKQLTTFCKENPRSVVFFTAPW